MAGGEIIDVLLRGMNAGALALLCIALLARRKPNLRQAFGAIFALGTAAYVLVSSPALVAAMGPLYLPMQALSLAAPVFFWWFSLALFDDKFRWRLPRRKGRCAARSWLRSAPPRSSPRRACCPR